MAPSGANTLDIVREAFWKSKSALRSTLRTVLQPQSRKTATESLPALRSPDRRPGEFKSGFPVLSKYELIDLWIEEIRGSSGGWAYHDVLIPLTDVGVYLVEGIHANEVGYTAVVISNLGMISKQGPESLLIFAADKTTGEPADHVQLEVVSRGKTLATGETDTHGLFKAPLKDVTKVMILGQKGKEFMIADPSYYRTSAIDARVYLYTERPVYRPKQDVFFKGIARVLEGERYVLRPFGDIRVEVKAPDGKVVYEDSTRANTFGAFSGSFPLEAAAPLGRYTLQAQLRGKSYSSEFKVEEYRKPEFKVTVRTDKPHYTSGEPVKATISASYYFGGPVARGQVRYFVFRSKHYQDWWQGLEFSWYYSEAEYRSYRQDLVRDGTGTLDAEGSLAVEVPTDEVDEDFVYTVEAQVSDYGRQAVLGRTSVKLTRGEFYASVSTDKHIYAPGEAMQLNIRTLDYAQGPISTSVEVSFALREWVGGRFSDIGQFYDLKALGARALTTDAAGAATLSFVPSVQGHILIAAVARDRRGKEIKTQRYVWVTAQAATQRYHTDGLELIPDKDSYQKGDTAHILVMSPTAHGHLLLTAEGLSLYDAQVRKLEGNSLVVDVPIKDAYAPNVFFNVAMLWNGQLFKKAVTLLVPPRDRFLQVQIRPDKPVYEPAERATYRIQTADYRGRPVSADVSLGVVDEAIYAISPEIVVPLPQFFYHKHRNNVVTDASIYFRFYGYAKERKARLAELEKQSYGLADFKAVQEDKARENLQDVAYWNPHIITDEQGRGEISFAYPDNLTTWRATATAVTEDTRVGTATAQTVTRKNLMVRLVTPPFFSERDRPFITTVVHNFTGTERQVTLSLEAEGVQLLDPTPKVVAVSADGERRVDWEAMVTGAEGATLTAWARSPVAADGIKKTLRILPHGINKSVGVAGILSDNVVSETLGEPTAIAEHEIILPPAAVRERTTLKVNLSTSLASAILSALDYLVGYPYGCMEQTINSFTPNVIVARILKENQIRHESLEKDLPKYIAAGLKRIYAFQKEDGGWGWWDNMGSEAFMSAYVVRGLLQTKEAGYDVHASVMQRGIAHLYRAYRSDAALDSATRAFVLYVLSSAGENIRSMVSKMYEAEVQGKENGYQRQGLNHYGSALLAMALDQVGLREAARDMVETLEHRVEQGIQLAHWTGSRVGVYDHWFEDPIEVTAYVLNALLRLKPESPLIPQGVFWLMSQRIDNHWKSTRDTATIVHALSELIRSEHLLAPDFTVGVSLNGHPIGDVKLGKENLFDRDLSLRASAEALTLGPNTLRIEKRGKGTGFYASHLTYYTTEESISPGQAGLAVTREYAMLERGARDAQGVIRHHLRPWLGEVRSGDEILVTLRVASDVERRYFMLEDFFPAGAAAIVDLRKYTIDGLDTSLHPGRHREAHDERVAFFLETLRPGVTALHYILRAELLGTYHAMPAQGKLMYFPEIAGNSAEEIVRISE